MEPDNFDVGVFISIGLLCLTLYVALVIVIVRSRSSKGSSSKKDMAKCTPFLCKQEVRSSDSTCSTSSTHATEHAATLEPVSCDGSWTDRNSGGCPNFPSWIINPTVKLARAAEEKGACELTVTLTQNIPEGGEGARIGLLVLKHDADRQLQSKKANLGKLLVQKSGIARAGSCELNLVLAASEKGYVLMPMTFEPGELASFQVSVSGRGQPVALTPGPNW